MFYKNDEIMPKWTPEINNLRFTTCASIQELLASGKYKCEKEALSFIVKLKTPCGFNPGLKKAYNQYRQFKHIHFK